MDSSFNPWHQVYTLGKILFTVMALCLGSLVHAEKTVYTYLGPGPINGYDRHLLRLALEKTIEEFGEFEIRYAPVMSEARARKSIRDQAYPHPIRSDAAHPKVTSDTNLTYIPFPIYYGILGYRVCFIEKQSKKEFTSVNTMDELQEFTQGQGEGWRDIHILEENGFKVKIAPGQTSLYKMLSARRIDLFCRGTNEVLNEKHFYDGIDNIVLDDSAALYYELPHFFYANTTDTHTRERLEKGILAAYSDGSMKALWRKHFGESVNFSRLPQRKVFKLHNRYTDGLDFEYEQYLYRPGEPFEEPIGPKLIHK